MEMQNGRRFGESLKIGSVRFGFMWAWFIGKNTWKTYLVCNQDEFVLHVHQRCTTSKVDRLVSLSAVHCDGWELQDDQPSIMIYHTFSGMNRWYRAPFALLNIAAIVDMITIPSSSSSTIWCPFQHLVPPKTPTTTVYGSNPAPPGMYKSLKIMV